MLLEPTFPRRREVPEAGQMPRLVGLAQEPKNSFEDKIDIIDAFLKNNPKIPPVSRNYF